MADPNQREGSTYVRPKHFGKIEIIKKDAKGKPVVYLRRWYLWRCKWFSIRVHHILLPDLDRDPHDHPWNFLSIAFKGGYREDWCRCREYLSEPVSRIHECGAQDCPYPGHPPMSGQVTKKWCGMRRRHVKLFSFHRKDDLHCIRSFDNEKDVWTLFLTGREQRVWGFRTPLAWVPWDEYEAAGEVSADPGDG